MPDPLEQPPPASSDVKAALAEARRLRAEVEKAARDARVLVDEIRHVISKLRRMRDQRHRPPGTADNAAAPDDGDRAGDDQDG
jgi:hypothetical protein